MESLLSNSGHILFFIILSVLSLFTVHILQKNHIHFIPECFIPIFFGIIGAAALQIVYLLTGYESVEHWTAMVVQMNPDTFFTILLPIIIFQAGYTMKSIYFFRNFGTIMLLSILGTFLSSIFIGLGIIIISDVFKLILVDDSPLPYEDAFIFGSLISAVDPVATIALFNVLKVDTGMSYIIMGESVVNDAVSIVLVELFRLIKMASSSTSSSSPFFIMLWTILKFLSDSIGSTIIGFIGGIIAALFFRFVDLRSQPLLETIFFGLFAYLPYIFALPFASGIVSILACSIFMALYLKPNLSKEGDHIIEGFLNASTSFSETLVFIYLGMALVTNQWYWNTMLIVSTIILVIISRAIHVFPFCFITNVYRKSKLGIFSQIAIWISGLRGAMAFALAMQLKNEFNTNSWNYLFSNTLFVILFSIFIFGGSLYPYMKIFKLEIVENKNTMNNTSKILKEVSKELEEFDIKKNQNQHTISNLNDFDIDQIVHNNESIINSLRNTNLDQSVEVNNQDYKEQQISAPSQAYIHTRRDNKFESNINDDKEFELTESDSISLKEDPIPKRWTLETLLISLDTILLRKIFLRNHE